MNDRSVSLLDKYDIEVLRTWKGRSAVLCETKQGIFIFNENPVDLLQYDITKVRVILQKR